LAGIISGGMTVAHTSGSFSQILPMWVRQLTGKERWGEKRITSGTPPLTPQPPSSLFLQCSRFFLCLNRDLIIAKNLYHTFPSRSSHYRAG